MCLITVLPKGKIKYNEEVESFIRNGMATNTDGSGFMYKRNGDNRVSLNKGYFIVEELLEDLKNLDLKEDDEVIIHHRTSTSGEVNAINTHPFVVSKSEKVLQSTKGTFNKPIMAHNGIFYTYSDYQSLYSDTYHFVEKFISDVNVLNILRKDVDSFKTWFSSVLSSNKLGFLFPDRDLIMIGQFIENNGYYHSNPAYKYSYFDRGGINNRTSSSNNQRQLTCAYSADNDRYSTDIKLPKILDKDKKTPNFKFNSNFINITKDNYKYFIVVANEDINKKFTKNSGYVFENFNEDHQYNYLVEYNKDGVMELINWDFHKDDFTIYVKNQYEVMYKGLYNIITLFADGKPTRSMLKKLKKTVVNKRHKSFVSYKHYGLVRISDLRYLINLFLDEDDSVETYVIKDSKVIEKPEDLITNAEIVEETAS